ncbi:MAG: hypothetical protein HY391_00850 [Deltaproteobacteria bacterium]|nr:hypothetical protein [Deltaproteobacteria bacterium]
MKRFSLLVMGISLFGLNAFASETYLLAPETKVVHVKNPGTHQTELTLSYQLPCWAEYVDNIEKTVIRGNPMNPAADFEVVVGVLLRGNKLNPCVDSQEKEVTATLNTLAVEGTFLGFKVIEEL